LKRAEAEAQLREVEDADRPLLAEVDALQASLSVLRAQYDELNSAAQTNEARHSARVEEIEARLHDAVAERETFRHRLDEREAECARLTEENAALQAASATQLDDAQSAFNEAFKLVSQPQEAAIERSAYEAIEQRLQDAEAECQRLAAQREERDSMVRALESEVEQLLELRRLQRQELVRALQESDESEQLASTRLAQCVRLRQMLNEAQASLQRLSEWAAHQSTRLSAPIDASGERLLPDVDAPTPRVVRRSNGAAASMEASWS
jgi:colicin import membrane protein